MRELRPGLWHWQARHPEWRESEPWDPSVSSYAIADDELADVAAAHAMEIVGPPSERYV